MKPGQGMLRKERPGEPERARLKTTLIPTPSPQSLPGNTADDAPGKKLNQDTIMVFNFEQYPFPNGQHTEPALLKTIINLQLSTQKLQKVIKLAHPNIIGLRKIVRSSPKQAFQGTRHRSYYSFYYQMVHYSLKDLVEDPNKNPRLFNQIKTVNLRAVLVGVVEYLKDAGIFYTARPEDLGVMLDGGIKVYIPPNLVFEPTYNANIHRAILTIADWWENCLLNSKFKKDRKLIQLQPPRLSDNGDLEFDEHSMKSSTLERELGELLDDQDEMGQVEEQNAMQLKQSTNSHFSEVTKLGSIQLEKMKRIDEEVKFIRFRLNQKTKRKHKQSDATNQKKQGKGKAPTLFQSQQSLRKGQEEKADYYPHHSRQPIQQNIHTINIYNHNPPVLPPNLYALPQYMHKNKPPYQLYYDHDLDPEFFDQDQEYSQDTYEIEFQNQFQMPTPATHNNNYRHTLFSPPERELSEYSEHCHRKGREGWGNQLKASKSNKPQTVQVCNKNVTESAGPLQFKSFVNKIIKPQFLAKKSNIYQDPGEDADESERDQEKYKKRQESSSKRTPAQGPAPNQQRHFSTQKSFNDMKKLANKSVAIFGSEQRHQSMKRISSQNDITKRWNSQNDFSVSKGRVAPDTQIQEKVKKALEKTKNAIALLNRVKSNKSNIKTLYSQEN